MININSDNMIPDAISFSHTGSTRDLNSRKEAVEDDLVLFSKNFQILLKGGTLEKIIEKLMYEPNPDVYNDIVDVFLLTYRGFITPIELLEKLFSHYPGDKVGLYYPGNEVDLEAKKRLVHFRLATIIKRWLQQHFHDFGNDQSLGARLCEMCINSFVGNDKNLCDSIISLYNQCSESFGNRSKKEVQFSDPPPDIIKPKGALILENLDPLELARQLCVFEQELYRDIEPKECLNQAWNKNREQAPHILNLISFFNNLSSYVANLIVSKTSSKKRGKLIAKFLKTLVFLREFNNFNSCQCISSALSSSSVYRLSISWGHAKTIAKKFVDAYEDVTKILSSGGSYSLLRKTIKSSDPPCIPYIGMYLTDLTFIEDGNPKYLPVEPERNDIINFEKMRKVAAVIQDIILYQQKPYNFEKIDEIQQLLKRIQEEGEGCDTEQNIFARSREVEPKEKIDEWKKKQKAEKPKSPSSVEDPKQLSKKISFSRKKSLRKRTNNSITNSQ